MIAHTRSRIGGGLPGHGVFGTGQGMTDRAGGERRTETGEEVLATVDVPPSDLQRPP
jgi:hypothetical protein